MCPDWEFECTGVQFILFLICNVTHTRTLLAFASQASLNDPDFAHASPGT